MEFNLKDFADNVMKLYLYADMLKAIHLSTDSYRCHELCDESQDEIREFIDEMCEQTYGYFGKPSFNDFKLEQNVYSESDLGKLLGRVMDIVTSLKGRYEKIEKLSGVVSLIDDFTGKLNQLVYLASFNKISDYKTKENI